MCKLCDDRFNSSTNLPRVETYDDGDSMLVTASWDCYNDCPEEDTFLVYYCPDCGKDLKGES